jgi:hypothetical protein
MPNLNLASAEDKVTGYWNRPGGKLKTFLFVALIGFAALKLFPVFTQALDNTTDMVIGVGDLSFAIAKSTFAVALAILSFIFVYTCFTSKKLKAIVTSIWDIIMDYTVGLVVPFNPVVLAREKIKEQFANVKKMEDSVDEVASKEDEIGHKIKDNQSQLIEIDKKMRTYASMGPDEFRRNPNISPDTVKNQVAVLMNKKEKLQGYTGRLTTLFNTAQTVRIGLNKMAGAAKAQAQIDSDNLEMLVDEYTFMKSANAAVSRFVAIISGQGDKAMMGDAAILKMHQDIASNEAKMKQTMRRNRDFIQSIDLENAVYDTAATNYIAEVTGQSTPFVGTQIGNTATVQTLPVTAAKSSYDNLI